MYIILIMYLVFCKPSHALQALLEGLQTQPCFASPLRRFAKPDRLFTPYLLALFTRTSSLKRARFLRLHLFWLRSTLLPPKGVESEDKSPHPFWACLLRKPLPPERHGVAGEALPPPQRGGGRVEVEGD